MVLSKDVYTYLTGKGWVPTSSGWISPYDEFQYVKWDLMSAMQIQEAHDKEARRADKEAKKKEVRDEWNLT